MAGTITTPCTATASLCRCTVARNRSDPQPEENVMPVPIPYLAFNGNCAEAIRFYERVLGGKIEMMMSGADSPMAAQIPKEFAQRILHARLALPDGGKLYAGDAPANVPYEGIKGVSIALSYDTTAQAQKVFDALA